MVLPPALDQLVDRNSPADRGGWASGMILGKDRTSFGMFYGHRNTPTSKIHCRGERDPASSIFLGCHSGAAGLDAQDFDRDDRDRLVTKHAFVGLDPSGDVGVL